MKFPKNFPEPIAEILKKHSGKIFTKENIIIKTKNIFNFKDKNNLKIFLNI